MFSAASEPFLDQVPLCGDLSSRTSCCSAYCRALYLREHRATQQTEKRQIFTLGAPRTIGAILFPSLLAPPSLLPVLLLFYRTGNVETDLQVMFSPHICQRRVFSHTRRGGAQRPDDSLPTEQEWWTRITFCYSWRENRIEHKSKHDTGLRHCDTGEHAQ